jgi:hypothetical protein
MSTKAIDNVSGQRLPPGGQGMPVSNSVTILYNWKAKTVHDIIIEMGRQEK